MLQRRRGFDAERRRTEMTPGPGRLDGAGPGASMTPGRAASMTPGDPPGRGIGAPGSVEAGPRGRPLGCTSTRVPTPMTDSRQDPTHAESGETVGGVPPLRILVVDDHRMIIDGLRAMLAPYERRAVMVGACTDAADVLQTLRAQAPDVVLLDMRVGKSSGLD